MKHCRGILLFGPPGTGKTLMARQIGNMLNAREPKIVNGPQVLDKYVGESEANIRKLFAEAEEEEKRVSGSLLCCFSFLYFYIIYVIFDAVLTILYAVKIVASFYKVQYKHKKPGVVGCVYVYMFLFQLPWVINLMTSD